MENLYLCVFPLLLVAFYSITLHMVSKLRNLPPTPFPALPLIGHIYLLRRPFHRSFSKVARRYGPALFLHLGSRPVLLISSPSLAEECLSSKNDVTFANRPSLLNGRHFGYNYTSLSWSSYGKHWRNLRKISSLELLSSKRILMFDYIRRDETLSLVRKLFYITKEENRRVVEVKSALFEYMFNVPQKNGGQVLLQGGTSTSTIALEWAFTLLLDNPEVLEKAQSEIDARVGQNRLITESDVAELPYLRQILLETMRLHPPVSVVMPHISSAECTVGGYRIPAGTILLLNLWEIHHSPFGLGRRACPGENLAFSNIGIALGALIQCFDWKAAGKIDMSEGAGTTTPKVQPLTAVCRPRPFIAEFL